MYVCANMRLCVYALSKTVGLASQFATQNCLDCYSKLNMSSKCYACVATHLLHIKLRT